jgi:hypothetical protein
MRAFSCDNCGRLVFFHNTSCLNCGHELAFDWRQRDLRTYAPEAPPHRCANRVLAACNAEVVNEGELCVACLLTRTRPKDADAAGMGAFREAESAKRHLLFELGELGLRFQSYREAEGGLAFDLLSSDQERVTTGHADGVITIDLAESDDARREQRRMELGEPYRTLLGHFRHEIGHFFFPILTAEPGQRAEARELFGDERADYKAALERHYENGPPQRWQVKFVSAYATMHPSEDWAETFAHFLHIHDTLQTAAAHRMRVDGPADAKLPRDPVPASPDDFESVLAEWLPLTYALNAINRSMGRDDLYPFVLSAPAMKKLSLVAKLARAARDDEPLG